MLGSKFWRDLTGQAHPVHSPQAETKRRGAPRRSAWRLGHAGGVVSRTYLKGESAASQWMERKGVPVVVCRLVAYSIRLLLIATMLYLSYFMASAMVAYLAFKQYLLGSPVEVYFSEDMGMDSRRLFPDPYSPEHMNDPAFHDD